MHCLPTQRELDVAWPAQTLRVSPVGIPQAALPQAMRSFPGEIPLGVEARKNRLARVEIRQEELQSM